MEGGEAGKQRVEMHLWIPKRREGCFDKFYDLIVVITDALRSMFKLHHRHP